MIPGGNRNPKPKTLADWLAAHERSKPPMKSSLRAVLGGGLDKRAGHVKPRRPYYQ